MRYKNLSSFLICLLAANLGFGAIRVSDLAATVIDGKDILINRPEGLAFSPDGDLLAVSDASKKTICFFKRVGDEGALFETTPCFILSGPESLLDYPHDLSFSPDGQRLAVANSYTNQILIYKRSSESQFFDLSPIAIIQGLGSTLNNPRAVKYAPSGDFIAVANGGRNTILLFRYQGDRYERYPYQIIKSFESILAIPDGLAFTSDGELLAVTSHDTNSVALFAQIPSEPGTFFSEPVQIMQGDETNFCYPHSLSFYGSDEYLAVSSAGGMKTVNIFKKTSDGYSNIPEHTLEIFIPKFSDGAYNPQEVGVKGVLFSPDGTSLAISVAGLHTYSGKIMIYPIESCNAGFPE